jgi:hypothetical protein
MRVILRKLAQANTQTGLIGSAVIETKLIPNKDQYNTGLAQGIKPQAGNGCYYLTISKNTDTSSWIEGEIIDVLAERGNFTTELGAEIESVNDRRANEINGTLSFEFTLQEKVLRNALKANILSVEKFNEKMDALFDKCLDKAEKKVEAKAQVRRATNPVTTRRDRRNNVDLTAFGVIEPKAEGLNASVPETVTTPETPEVTTPETVAETNP